MAGQIKPFMRIQPNTTRSGASSFLRWTCPGACSGENLTLTGLEEKTLYIGDRFQVGSAQLQVTQPRLPCYKLGIKFGRQDMLKRFLRSELTGFYFRVLQEGDVAAGDPSRCFTATNITCGVTDITSLYSRDKHNLDLMRRVIKLRPCPQSGKITSRNVSCASMTTNRRSRFGVLVLAQP